MRLRRRHSFVDLKNTLLRHLKLEVFDKSNNFALVQALFFAELVKVNSVSYVLTSIEAENLLESLILHLLLCHWLPSERFLGLQVRR